MTSSESADFRFCDLPREIRAKIYRDLLCDWKPQPTTIDVARILNSFHAARDIHTAILRTNKAISREAYDVMIKTNRFIKITSVYGAPLRKAISSLQVPIVASNGQVVDAFHKYVMAVHFDFVHDRISSNRVGSTNMLTPCKFMILHRDLDAFCEAVPNGDVHIPGFSEVPRLSITVAPLLVDPDLANTMLALQEFFSDKTQKSLLGPFRNRLRGFKHVRIQGHVDSDLANTVQEEMQQDRWPDHEHVLRDLRAAKDKGSSLFKQGKQDEGCLIWQDAVVNIDKVHESTSWPSLVKPGGEQFVSQLAELYFLVRLNIAHVQIFNVQRSGGMTVSRILAQDALTGATRAMKRDHWMEGYKLTPSIQHLAKLRYRYALLMRLEDEPGTSVKALSHIVVALRLQPGDTAILKEMSAILAWKVQRHE
jgi:hypothetical protein